MKFVKGSLDQCSPGDFLLVGSDWDDYGYETSFVLYFVPEKGTRTVVGGVKILVRVDAAGPPNKKTRNHLRDEFNGINPTHGCSVGQDASYYERLYQLPHGVGQEVLQALHDASSPQVEPWWEETTAWKNSLLRENTAILAWQDAPGIMAGQPRDGATHKVLPYERGKVWVRGGPDSVTFKFDGSLPVPGRLNVIVGKNGVGKTSLLAGMKNWFSQPQPKGRWDFRPDFLKVLVVSFNPFDDEYTKDWWDTGGSNVRFVGFKPMSETLRELVSSDQGSEEEWKTKLCETFPTRDALKHALPRGVSRDEVLTALSELADDPGWIAFISGALGDLAEGLITDPARTYSKRMSAGQRALTSIYALLFTELAANTLVIVDEPENHLHPSLIASFVRELTALLAQERAFALIATHSPVIVQETPSQFVWVLERTGNTTTAEHPAFETFGESIENITEYLFETDFKSSNWKSVLRRLAHEGKTAEQIQNEVGNNSLSIFARSYLAYQLPEEQ